MEFNHVNTAARVAGILGEAARHPGDRQSILDTWAKVFDVADEDPEVAAAAVFRRLVLLRDEIEAVRQAMVHTTVRPEKVKGPCDSARNATTIRNLEQAWSVAAQHIPPQVVNAFSIWADILPPEEEVVDEEVRSSLLEEIGHVREAALDDDISEDLRRFVLEQVNALERGVREYDVRGIGALRTAIYRVDGGLHIHFGAQPEADEPESVSALRRVYRKARMVAVQATLFTAAISGADDVAKIVGKTARYFLPPPAVEQADIAAPKPKAIDDGKGAVIGPTKPATQPEDVSSDS